MKNTNSKENPLTCLIFNCTLKESSATSNTQALIDKVKKYFEQNDVTVETLRVVDYDIAFGTSSDEGKGDEWPILFEKIKEADIFIIATPVWMGKESSLVQLVIERLDALFHEKKLQDKKTGQYLTYNKVGGALATGNEDGAKGACFSVIARLSNLGFTVPPIRQCFFN